MAAAWGWWPALALPAWLGSSALWFVVVNAVVAAVAVLSSRARPPLPSPRSGGAGVTRRASSAVLSRLRSFSIFSFPSACFNTAPPFTEPDTTAAQETGEPAPATMTKQSPRSLPVAPSPRAERGPATMTKQSPRSLPVAPSPRAERAPAAEDGEGGEGDGMSMDEAYALALEARQRPERQREEEARRSEVNAMAEQFIRVFKEDLRQQRLNSIFNYTQMLKKRAFGGGRSPTPPGRISSDWGWLTSRVQFVQMLVIYHFSGRPILV